MGMGACEDVVRPWAEALGIIGVETVTRGDADDGRRDDARVGFKRTSYRCDGFTVVRGLTRQGGGMVDGDVFLFNLAPHEFARRDRKGVGLW